MNSLAKEMNYEDPFIEKNIIPENVILDLDTHRVIFNHFPCRRDHVFYLYLIDVNCYKKSIYSNRTFEFK